MKLIWAGLRRRARKYIYRLNTFIGKLKLKFNNCTFGTNLKINGSVYIENEGTIQIGNNVTINSSETSNPIGGGTADFDSGSSKWGFNNRIRCWNVKCGYYSIYECAYR